MTSSRHELVDEYLHRFDNASVFLPADRREELKQEIVEHIEAGLEEADVQHADAVRTVLERLGPPATIVAAELNGPRSTGSTPVVKPVALSANVAHEHEAHSQEQPRRVDIAQPPASSPPPRKRTRLLIGAAATVLVVGALAFGISTANDGPERAPGYQGPTITPSPSHGTGSTSVSGQPTDDAPTAPPSDGHSDVSNEPTAQAS